MRKIALQMPRSVEKEDTQVKEQRAPAVVNTMVRQAGPLKPMKVDGGADDPPAAHGGGCAQRRLGPHGKSGLKQAPGRTSTLVSSLFFLIGVIGKNKP